MSVERVEMPATIPGPEAPAKPQAQPPDGKSAQPPAQPVPQTPPAAEQPQRPEWCPEKFWKDGKVDHESMAKSYTELERMRTGKPPAESAAEKPKAPEGEQKPAEEQPKSGDQPAQSPIPGVTTEEMTSYGEEFKAEGKLTDTSYEKLAKAGYSREVVDAYIRGIQANAAAAEQSYASIKDVAGGEEGFTKLVDWAKVNIPKSDLDAYNALVDQMTAGQATPEQVKLVVQGFNAKYQEAMGKDPSLITGQTPRVSSDVFRSAEEMKAAMRDPRYKTSEDYRREVAAKIKRSGM